MVAAALAEGTSVLITGAAGMGKTTLAAEAIRSTGRSVRRGAAVRFLEQRSFLSLSSATGAPIRLTDDAGIAADVMAAIGDAILFLDDLQWASADTVAVLQALAAHGRLVAAVRPGEGMAGEVIDELHARCVRIDLRSLDEGAASELVTNQQPSWPPSRIRAAVASAGGIPLLLKLASGLDRREQASIEAIVASCSHEAVVALAKLGLRHPGVDRQTPGVQELADRHLVHVDGHAGGSTLPAGDALGEAALRALSAPERNTLHADMARAATNPGDAAVHWRAAGDRGAAFAAASAAAESATTTRSRAQFWTLACEVAEPADRWTVTRRACDEWLRVGRLDEIERLVAEAEQIAPRTFDTYRWELMRAQLLVDQRRPGAALVTIEEAFDRFPNMPLDYRCWFTGLRAAAKAWLFDIEAALADAELAIDLGAQASVTVEPAKLIRGSIRLLSGDPRWVGDLASVLDRAAADDPPVAMEAGCMMAFGQFLSGDREGAEAVCDRLLRLADDSSNVVWDRRVRSIRAVHGAFLSGGDPASTAQLRDLVDDPATFNSRAQALAALVIVEADRGNIGLAEDLLERATATMASPDAEDPHLAWAEAELAWNLDASERTAAASQRAMAFSSVVDICHGPASVLARWAALDTGAAVDELPAPVPVLPGHRGLTFESDAIAALQAGDLTSAVEAFLSAALLHDTYLRRNALRCRWAAGAVLGRSGDTSAARTLLLEARAEAARHGTTMMISRINASLRELGDRRTDAVRSDDPISARQREVLSLVAQGLGTTEIAARLHIKPTTVDSHIRSGMVRLGVRSRLQAALLVTTSGSD